MNRFSNYLASMKLVKLHILGAEEYWKKGQEQNFKHNVIGALREMQTAMNNLASMQFEKKRRTVRR